MKDDDWIEPEVLPQENKNKQLPQGTGDPGVDLILGSLSIISQSMTQITTYKYKLKELELKRSALKDRLLNDQETIRTIAKIEMKEIDRQSEKLENVLNVISQEIKGKHIERMELIDSIRKLTDAIIDPHPGADPRILHDVIKDHSETLRTMGNQGVASLKHLAETTQKAIQASNEKRSKFNISYTPKQ